MPFMSLFYMMLAILILFITYKITKKILVTLTIFFLIITISLTIFGFIVYNDFKTFQSGIDSGDKILLLVDDSRILAGVSWISEASFEVIDRNTLDEFELNYQNNEYDKILGDKFSVFFIKLSVIENNLEDEYLDNIKKDEVIAILTSDINIEQSLDPNELRANIFMVSFSSIIANKSPLFIIDEHKNDNIVIYPDFIVLKVLRKIPSKILNSIASKLN